MRTAQDGTIRLPSSDTAPVIAHGGPPSPEAVDDTASVHSRHALKVFRRGSGLGKDDGSPMASDITLPIDDDRHDASTGRTGAGGDQPKTPEELAEWRAFQKRTLLKAAIQFTILLVACAGLLALTLYIVLPPIDPEDRAQLKIPRSFDQLKALNSVLQRYKDEYFFRVLFCWIVIYMFLQAFSIPGSMYMSIIAGAMYGVPLALPIVCASVATGATICYLISKYLGAVLVAMPKWKARVDAWGEQLAQHNDNMMSYLIVIRMMPLPPHNVVNILAPHLGIGIPLFWTSTFFGIFAVSVIHVTIGEKLDQMTSADDFHLFSFRNVLLLGGVILAVLTPVMVRKYSSAAASPLEEDVNGGGRIRLSDDDEEVHRRNPYDSDEDEDADELPRVRRLQGASRTRGGLHTPDDLDEEGRAAYVARAWRGVEMDADQESDGGDLEAGSGGGRRFSDSESGSLPVFEDRREQGGAPRRARHAPPKARRVLGMGRGGAASRRRGQQDDSYLSRIQGWVGSAFGGR